MFLEDLEPRTAILSWLKRIQRYLGCRRWCGWNCVTERQRRWETQKRRRDGGWITWHDQEVVCGGETSDEVEWLYR